ncbi:MAG: sodium:proton antiporter [Planctomycetes bacterium]|nr:sodium:proton antiporter [Planctomycetota bacterium]
MKKVALFSLLLVAGMIASQFLPGLLGDAEASFGWWVRMLTMIALSFIMIHVGYEFELRKDQLRSYGWDYVVAMTAAAFPWLFVAGYFALVLMPEGSWTAWKEALLAGRFAAPTSAGVLFSMLAAAGLSATWFFRKTRILAIFDDLDTVLLMIPLKIMIVGFAWQLGILVVLMAGMIWLAWKFLHRWKIPVTWPWVIGYATVIVAVSELIYVGSKGLDAAVPIHIEVLLPAFVLGCVMMRPPGTDPHVDDERDGHQEGPESAEEQKVATIISAVFMALVGLSMPAVASLGEIKGAVSTLSAAQPMPGWGTIALHVLAVSFLANLGKMFPMFCYRKEAHWKERLAIAIGMWPRGEVGAGIIVLSLGYGLGGPMLVIAVSSLALNLLLTGVFIVWVKKLLASATEDKARAVIAPATAG